MDGFIKEVAGICAQIKQELKSEKDVYLSFDEWNVWYHFQRDKKEPEKWTFPRAIEEEEYNFLDALAVGSIITTLINNSDTVKISCLAQLVNVLAPIMTVPGGPAWVQTTYWPFLHACTYGRGKALKLDTESPVYNCKAMDTVPYLSSAAVLSEDGRYVTLFLVNKSLDEEMRLIFSGIGGKMAEWISMEGYSIYDINTAEGSTVLPTKKPLCDLNETVLSAASWNVIRVEL